MTLGKGKYSEKKPQVIFPIEDQQNVCQVACVRIGATSGVFRCHFQVLWPLPPLAATITTHARTSCALYRSSTKCPWFFPPCPFFSDSSILGQSLDNGNCACNFNCSVAATIMVVPLTTFSPAEEHAIITGDDVVTDYIISRERMLQLIIFVAAFMIVSLFWQQHSLLCVGVVQLMEICPRPFLGAFRYIRTPGKCT